MSCLLLRSDMKLEALNIVNDMCATLDVVDEWCMLFENIILLHWNTGLLINAQVSLVENMVKKDRNCFPIALLLTNMLWVVKRTVMGKLLRFFFT